MFSFHCIYTQTHFYSIYVCFSVRVMRLTEECNRSLIRGCNSPFYLIVKMSFIFRIN